MIMERLQKGDEVVVISGSDRGKRGSVVKVLRDGRLLVRGVRMVKRHTKPNPQANQPGGVIEKEAPIHHSNVALYNPATGKAGKIGFKYLEDGKKVRYFKPDGEVLDA